MARQRPFNLFSRLVFFAFVAGVSLERSFPRQVVDFQPPSTLFTIFHPFLVVVLERSHERAAQLPQWSGENSHRGTRSGARGH
jgi:hypothetical protein